MHRPFFIFIDEIRDFGHFAFAGQSLNQPDQRVLPFISDHRVEHLAEKMWLFRKFVFETGDDISTYGHMNIGISVFDQSGKGDARHQLHGSSYGNTHHLGFFFFNGPQHQLTTDVGINIDLFIIRHFQQIFRNPGSVNIEVTLYRIKIDTGGIVANRNIFHDFPERVESPFGFFDLVKFRTAHDFLGLRYRADMVVQIDMLIFDEHFLQLFIFRA